jgi:hypothetical protein
MGWPRWSEREPGLEDREHTIVELRESIRRLRSLLDGEVEERRRLLALLTGPERRSWWRWWFR